MFWIEHKIEEKLSKIPSLNYDTEAEVRVAVTSMAFHNGKLIKLLRDRGHCIRTENWVEQ